MNGLTGLAAIWAVLFTGLAVVFSVSLIVGHWREFEGPTIWKSVASMFILPILSGVIHVVPKRMSGPLKEEP